MLALQTLAHEGKDEMQLIRRVQFRSELQNPRPIFGLGVLLLVIAVGTVEPEYAVCAIYSAQNHEFVHRCIVSRGRRRRSAQESGLLLLQKSH